MGNYMRKPEMMVGGPFRCFNCGNLLAIKMGGNHFKLELQCGRCKTYYMIKTKDPIPFKHIPEEVKVPA